MSTTFRAGIIALLGVIVLASSGCESIGIALGLRTRLDKVPVTALTVALSSSPALAPGRKGQLILTAATADGKTLTTVGAGKGKVLFDSFTFDATGVQVKKGVVLMPADPRITESQMPHVHIGVIGHPDISADLDVPVRYDAAFKAHFVGAAGVNGIDGLAGSDGASGMTGSMDPNSPSPGGNGTDGGRGEDGGNGGEGQPGPDVHVWMTTRSGTPVLLEVRVTGGTREQFFLVDPNGGTLSIDSNGGAGGRGGSGGRGGQGGSGGFGSPNGMSGNDGLNGFDGHAGAGGAAGTIEVSIDPSAQQFQSRLILSNRSGDGARGPIPQIHVQAVPALW
jgi:hypothetical protein